MNTPIYRDPKFEHSICHISCHDDGTFYIRLDGGTIETNNLEYVKAVCSDVGLTWDNPLRERFLSSTRYWPNLTLTVDLWRVPIDVHKSSGACRYCIEVFDRVHATVVTRIWHKSKGKCLANFDSICRYYDHRDRELELYI